MKQYTHLIFVILLIYSCSPGYYTKINNSGANNSIIDGIPNYGRLDYWAAHPDKWDPADSISQAVTDKQRDTGVDVFFLHPTTFTSAFKGVLNGELTNDTLNAKTDYSSILYQASVFNSQQNIFAPRYRQAHIMMYFYEDSLRAKQAFDTAYADVKKAFEYYLSLKRNKPFVIAAHSQGTQHAKRLITEMIDQTELREKMIAAYLIGMPIAEGSFKTILSCKDSTQTGCYVSWRTYRENYIGPDYIKKEGRVTVTNPLNWTTDTTIADRSMHKGALLMNYHKKIPAPNNARVSGNVLWISKPRFPGSAFYVSKNYHVGDYNLFYFNIREDVIRRIQYYKQQHQNSAVLGVRGNGITSRILPIPVTN